MNGYPCLGFGIYFYSTLLPLLVQAAACLTRWVIYVGTLGFKWIHFRTSKRSLPRILVAGPWEGGRERKGLCGPKDPNAKE